MTGAIHGVFSIGRLAFLKAPLPMYGFLLSRAAPSDWRILKRKEVRVNLLQGVAEGFRPGIRGAIEEMRVFSRAWNIPFEAITAPAFLWQGDADRNVPVSAALKLGELIPGCRVFKLAGAGHYWIFDNMRDVLQTVKAAVQNGGTAGQQAVRQPAGSP
jgi:pimeloyl-ACP methyl ester carboxylesterase